MSVTTADDILLLVALGGLECSQSQSQSDDLLLLALLEENSEEQKAPRCRLNFNKFTDEECIRFFRFNKEGICQLMQALHIPERYTCSNGTVATGKEALLILLRRLAYPNRLCELAREFGRLNTEICLIFNTILDDIYDRYSPKLTDLQAADWINLRTYCQAVCAKGCPVDTCWGFVDGTTMQCCRPIEGQQVLYSGHKRYHCIKFQSLMTPSGIIAHLYGPIEGRRHDAFMLAESGLLEQLEQGQFRNYVVYGDPAYPIRPQLLAPFRGDNNAVENLFNKEMSKVRQSVEWGFGKIAMNFAFLNYSRNLKIFLQPIAKYYVVGAFLTNCHTCLYGSQTGDYFQCDPPTLEQYCR